MNLAPRARRAVALFLIVAAGTTRASDADSAPKLSAHLEPDPIGREELATFTLVVESSGFGAPDVEPDFRLDNFQLAGGPFRSSNQSWVNGVTSSSIQLVWRLRPLAVGPAAVRALRVKVGGELVQLPDVLLQVMAEAPQRDRRVAPQRRALPDPFGSLFGDDPFGRFDPRRPRPPTAEPKLHVRALAEPSTVWAGQQLVWRLLLDTQTDVTRVEPRQMPDFRGFWVRDITPQETPAPRWLEIDGERYARVPVIERALFPLETGALKVPSVDVQVVAQIVDVDYYRPIARPKAFDLSTGAVTVVVKPLPAAPEGLDVQDLVVGRLELTADLDRARIDAGQTASFALTATSIGYLQSLAPPTLDLPDGLRAFPPTRESEDKVLGGRLQSTVKWRYVLLADRAGSFTLAPVEMPFFDPESASYRTARTATLDLLVRQSAQSAPAPAGPMPVESPAPSTPATARSSVSAGGSGLRRGILLIATAAGLVVVGGVLWTRRRHSSRPSQELKAALAAAERETSARAAAAQIEEAWRRFLAERWSIARSLPSGQWASRLASKRVAAETWHELAELFEELHFLAYAPELAEIEAHRAEVISRSRRLVRRLR